MYIFLIVLHVIACTGLVAIVLLQTGKGTGLANVFGSGGGAQSVFGAQTGDVLTRGTAILAGMFLLTSISLAGMSMKRGSSIMRGPSRAMRGERRPMMPVSSSIPGTQSMATQDLLNKIKETVKGVQQTVQKSIPAVVEKSKSSGVKTEIPAVPVATAPTVALPSTPVEQKAAEQAVLPPVQAPAATSAPATPAENKTEAVPAVPAKMPAVVPPVKPDQSK